MVGVRACKVAVGLMMAVGMAGGARAQAQCGSAVLGERAQPAVFQGITLGGSSVARLWSLGQASANVLAGACGVGCRSFSASPLCDGGGDCTAVTGVEWLNGSCATAGFLPQTSVLLVEGTTTADGGRWAAIKVDRNAGDANFDLDAAAAAICGPSCAALAALSRLRVLDGLPSPTPRASGRKRHHRRHLPCFASRDGEKCGLAAQV